MSKKKYRVKKKPIIILVVLLILVIGGIVGLNAYKKYQEKINSNEYKLAEIGYNEAEIEKITKYQQEYINIILEREYNELYADLFSEKYFILDNLDKYVEYKKQLENKNTSLDVIVAKVNVRVNEDYYSNPTKADLSKGNLVLVNKYNYVDTDYEPDDLVDMGLQYAFSGKKIKADVYDAFKDLVIAAKAEGLTIVANSTFRDYAYQEKLYNDYKNRYGTSYAENYAAHAGYSEHQTGLAIDVSTLSSTLDNFESTEEFEWISKHCYEYGFILRYPKDKEDITGYNYEPWHYRYVGVDVAKEIQALGITFDEYYAYYLK